mmetsp:Transcript_12330/g.42941  ORF Transcript_12330/g.42941 Transcript_12330/m.42941 type:complete len:271 (-) Transcript_12330:145-957(-)
MECERIVINQNALYSLCQIRNTGQTSPSTRPLIDVHAAGPSSKTIIKNTSSIQVYPRKQAIQECAFDPSWGHMRNEDFLSKVQELLLHQALGPSCLQLAEYLCLKFSGSMQMTILNNTECCHISGLADSWTITDPVLFNCWCGSGFRAGKEQCDDGNLAVNGLVGGNIYTEGCNTNTSSCPTSNSPLFGYSLRTNDGCNEFCQVESSSGWSCYRDPAPADGGWNPDICVCDCNCNSPCTCQDAKQKTLCGIKGDGSKFIPELQSVITCCF